MQKPENRKIKLIALYKLLQKESDSEHMLSTRMICERMADMEIPVNRRTLAGEIDALIELGCAIRKTRTGHSNGYYYDSVPFTAAELKTLIDAVEAATFIPQKRSADLKERLAQEAGSRKAEVIRGHMICFNKQKHSNEEIFQSVEIIEKALERKKKISFFYFDLDEKGCRILRKEGKRYVTDPVALVYNSDNYYLLSWTGGHSSRTTYRVDRMEEVCEEPGRIAQKALINDSDLGEYMKRVFRMYNGKPTQCTLEFERGMLGQIYDKFGEQIAVRTKGADLFQVRVRVEESPPFFGWIFQYGGAIRIVQPEALRQSYLKMCESALKQIQGQEKDGNQSHV